MADSYLGEIRLFPYTFNPRDWLFCDGQILSISQYSALFSILGATYGGDGRSNMQLPDLKGRAPIHPGTGSGLSSYSLGQKSGTEGVVISSDQMPAHSHQLKGSHVSGSDTTYATQTDPADHFLGQAEGDPSARGGQVLKHYKEPSLSAGAEAADSDLTTPSESGIRPLSSSQIVPMHEDALSTSGNNQAHQNMQPYLAINYCICIDGEYPSPG
ncbi:MAG: phage tail protein [Magnetococcales bacterium]|nr:phage tail protein [Magnetococcales bacterium]